MRILSIFLFLLAVLPGRGQTYYGFDSTQFNGVNAIVLVPGAGKYGLRIEIGPQAENLSNSPQGLSALFSSGAPKMIKNGLPIYPANPLGGFDSLIIIKWQPASYGDHVFGQDVAATVTAILGSSYASHIDTSKYSDGTYKYLGLAGQERGADAIFNFIVWQSGVSFGSSPLPVSQRFKKFYLNDINDPFNFSAYTSPGFSNAGKQIIKYFGKTGDFNIAVSDSIGKYSATVQQVLKNLPALTYSQISDSMYSIMGTDSAHNITRHLLDDAGTITPPTPQIKPAWWYEMGNYSSGDSGKSRYLFDSSGGFVDPLAGIVDFPSPQNLFLGLPYKQYSRYYNNLGYPGDRRGRIFVDLVGAKDARDITRGVNLSSIYAFSNGQATPDTVIIRGADTMCTVSVDQTWKFLARPDSLLPIIGYLITANGVSSWQHVNVNHKYRYILLQFNLLQHTFGMTTYYTTADYRKFIFYGTYDTSTAFVHKPYAYTSGLYPKPQTYGSFTGTNLAQGVQYPYIQYNGNVRIYGSTGYWDKSHKRWSADSTNAIDSLHKDAFLDVGPPQYDTMKRNGQKFWWTIKGPNNYMAPKAPQGWSCMTDDYPQEAEDWHSYGRRGKLMFELGALHGTIATSTSLTHWDVNTGNGMNDYYCIEPGNEEDEHDVSPLAIWLRLNCEYDGYEHRLGGYFGCHTSVSDIRMMMPATAIADTFTLRLFGWFGSLMRTDKRAFPFDIGNFHQYLRTTDTLTHAPSLDQQVGAHGESAEKDNIIPWFNGYTAVFYCENGGDTTMKVWCSETGYGNWGYPAPNATLAGAYPWDIGNTPSVYSGPTLIRDSMTQKAYLMARLKIKLMFSHVWAMNEFFFSNSDFGPNTQSLFQDYGATTGYDGTIFAPTQLFPEYYYDAGIKVAMRNYLPDRVVKEGADTGVTVYQLVNQFHSDSVLYVRVQATYNGTTVSSRPLVFNKLANSSVNKVVASTTVLAATVTPMTATGNGIVDGVDEGITMYFVKEAPLTSKLLNIYRKP